MKDLRRYDGLKLRAEVQENRIANFIRRGKAYENVIAIKDSIIDNKDEIIGLKDKLLNKKVPLQFNSYLGAETYNLDIDDPTLYYRVMLEFKKINVGARANYRFNIPMEQDPFYFNVQVEYKIF